MSAGVGLETPEAAEELYVATTPDELSVLAARPYFTGDVFVTEEGGMYALVQHPCAMRRGADLAPRLLVAEVGLLIAPRDWGAGSFKKMFLPELNGQDLAMHLDRLEVIERDHLQQARRVAILSEAGVALVVQRWLYHNSRVVVATRTIHEQIIGPFEEADLIEAAVADLRDIMDDEEALRRADDWLSGVRAAGEPPRRVLLGQSTQRSVIRREMREWVASLL